MEIVTWNVQNGRGVDGAVDLARVAGVVRGFADPDVVCLQEIACGFAELDGGAGADQAAELAALFPGYQAVFGAGPELAAEAPGRFRRFGNMVLSRLRVLQVLRHLLPSPADPGVKQMPRQATEVVVAGDSGPLRVVTTHLAFHSPRQRRAQAERLRELHREAAANNRAPPLDPGEGPYARAARPDEAVFCGDFNFGTGDPDYAAISAGFEDGTPRLCDAWQVLHGARLHDPTCGIFDRVQWPEGPHCRDFFFVTEDLAARVAAVEVELETAASDHQPLRLVLRD